MSFRYSISTLRDAIKPFRLVWLPTVGSTNTWSARARRKKKLFAPAVVLTGRQTSGRGRGKNRFVSPPGVMTATFVLPVHDGIPPNLVPLFAGVATREAIREVTGIEVGLKWPNDLYQNARKIAGILCERVDGVDLIGIGINVNLELRDLPQTLRSRTTSLVLLTSAPVDLNQLVIVLTQQLAKHLIHPSKSNTIVLKEYSRHHALSGQSVRVVEDGKRIEGKCEGIDRHGRLIVQTPIGREYVVCGTVSRS